MKKLLLILGFLVVPSVAHGQAFSPWVQQVLDRADQGIALAQGIPAPGSCDPGSLQSEIHENQSLIRQLVIPFLEREVQSQSLRERTVCVESDRKYLQVKIRAVQDEMDEAIRNCRITSTQMLRENYAFLFRAYMTFSKGATDPTVHDDLLHYRYAFHDQALFDARVGNPVAITGSTAPLCPYTTDFGVHSIAELPGSPGEIRSFGCDTNILTQISLGPINEEAANLKDFMDRTQDLATHLYDTVSTALFNIDTILAIIRGTPPPTGAPGSQPPPPHAALNGCLKPDVPNFLTDSPGAIDAVLLAYPDYFESYNLRDDGSGGFTYGPPPDKTLPRGMLHIPTIDFFLVQPAAGIQTRSFTDKRSMAAENRPLPDHLVSQVFDTYLEAIFRGANAITQIKTIESNIEREMAIFDLTDRDAMQRMQDASVPLEEAVNSLIDVTEEFLPKEYTPELTFFLARSCVDGHCQRTLDAVAKRTFNPYCHPYVSGKYAEEDAAKKCFCDPSMQSKEPDFWKEYCSADFNENIDRYNAMEPTRIPACMESSSSAPTGP